MPSYPKCGVHAYGVCTPTRHFHVALKTFDAKLHGFKHLGHAPQADAFQEEIRAKLCRLIEHVGLRGARVRPFTAEQYQSATAT